ncbi:MAG TPA: hypothetical protein VK891_05645 [Euzebyales bacterium]|nr:hypothetical protein [Euzebyales bacterium]
MTGLAVRGINYDAGVLYEGTFHSRPVWRPHGVRRDLAVIRDELSCNAVSIMATDNRRLAVASFGIVKVTRAAGDDPPTPERWSPKAAFRVVADRYREMARQETS